MKLIQKLGIFISFILVILLISSQIVSADSLSSKESVSYKKISSKVSILDLKDSGSHFVKQPNGSTKDVSPADGFCSVDPDQNREAILYENVYEGREVSLGDNVRGCPYDDETSNYQRVCFREDIFGDCLETFNDKASSLRIRSGYVALFSDKDFGGDMRVYGPGKVGGDGNSNEPGNWESFNLIDEGFNDIVSSAKWSEERP